MRIYKTVPIAAIMVGATLIGGTAFAKETLEVGSPAPALKVAKWVKGKPVPNFEKGKVYVVEFWATWCGPCKESIPHLTDLAKKYKGKATFTGVSVWEQQESPTDTKYMTTVASFVKSMGGKMNYNVAVDGPGKVMAKTWMVAAEQEGIPTAFVVGKQGNIVWIGHPMSGLDEIVGQVVSDKYDEKAAIAKMESEKTARATEKKRKALTKDAFAFAEDGKFAEAADKLEVVLKDHPEYEAQLAASMVKLLLYTDGKRASEYAKKVAEGVYKDDAQMLNGIAWPMVDDATMAKDVDYAVAVEIAERAVSLTKDKDGMIMDTLAYAYFKAGDVDKAIATGEKAVKLTSGDSKVPAEAKREIKDRLDIMKSKKK